MGRNWREVSHSVGVSHSVVKYVTFQAQQNCQVLLQCQLQFVFRLSLQRSCPKGFMSTCHKEILICDDFNR